LPQVTVQTTMTNFSQISKTYEKDSIVQRSASEMLFDLINIQPHDDVLDLGCGTGHITKQIRERTDGRIVGIDPSEGMIRVARTMDSKFNLAFATSSAEAMNFTSAFNAIFCNSVFQCFKRREMS
jgi:ubiquinone/menaquinone biosynthesis C-methylase UbiE